MTDVERVMMIREQYTRVPPYSEWRSEVCRISICPYQPLIKLDQSFPPEQFTIEHLEYRHETISWPPLKLWRIRCEDVILDWGSVDGWVVKCVHPNGRSSSRLAQSEAECRAIMRQIRYQWDPWSDEAIYSEMSQSVPAIALVSPGQRPRQWPTPQAQALYQNPPQIGFSGSGGGGVGQFQAAGGYVQMSGSGSGGGGGSMTHFYAGSSAGHILGGGGGPHNVIITNPGQGYTPPSSGGIAPGDYDAILSAEGFGPHGEPVDPWPKPDDYEARHAAMKVKFDQVQAINAKFAERLTAVPQ